VHRDVPGQAVQGLDEVQEAVESPALGQRSSPNRSKTSGATVIRPSTDDSA